MKKSKKILLFKLIIFFITIIYSLFIVKNDLYKSNYIGTEESIIGVIDYINIQESKVSIELKGKDLIIVNYVSKEFNYKLGDKVKITGIINKPKKNTTFNLFDYCSYLKSKKIYWLFTANNIELISKNESLFYKIKTKIINRINTYSTNQYLLIFLLGDTKNIDDDIYKSYQKNGIIHLFSISGMHITILSSILLLLFKGSKKYLIVILFLIFYVYLTRFSPSIVRAAAMFIFLYLNKLYKLNYKSLEILVFIFCLMLIYNPFYLYNIGFLFSFVVSFYLLSFLKQINKYKNYIMKTLVMSLISFGGSFPILINNYFEVNLMAPLLNIIFIPLVSFIIFPFAILTFFVPYFNNIFLYLIKIMENLSSFFNNYSVSIIFAKPALVVYLVYFIIIYFVIKEILNKKFFLFLLLFLILLIHYNISNFNNNTLITMLDVRQGDAILIQYDHNKGNILIDTGSSYYDYSSLTIIPYLKSLGIKTIDYLIITHGDEDHIGGAINLINNYNVNKVIFNCGTYNDLENELIKVLDTKNVKYYTCIKELSIDKYKLSFLNTKEYDNENDNSNVIYFNSNNCKFLFMGDAGLEKEKDILDKYDLKDIDFIKVGHHGSNTSSSKEFIDSINPKYSLISVGKSNRYGHPKESVLETLSKAKIYRTDLDGSIEIKLNKNGYKIRTCSP